MVGKHPCHMDQKVIEIDGIRFEQSLLILGIGAGDDGIQVIADRRRMTQRVLFGRHEIVFGLADPSQ